MSREKTRDLLSMVNKSLAQAIQHKNQLAFIKENLETMFHEVDRDSRETELLVKDLLREWKSSLFEGEMVTESSMLSLERRLLRALKETQGVKE